MFTGLIEDVGSIRSLSKTAQDWNITVATTFPQESINLGDSIAVNGVCLTVTAFGGDTFTVVASQETILATTFGELVGSSVVNLERAMLATGRLHGHLVQGHVDAVGKVVSIRPVGRSLEIWFEVGHSVTKYLVAKGSVAIDGVSLTINKVEQRGREIRFSINLIPHSQDRTTLANLRSGSKVNVETDIIGRYVERLLKAGTLAQAEVLDEEFLRKKGYL